MVDLLREIPKIAIAISPSIFIFILTLIIFSTTAHTKSLFFTHSISSIPIRFIIITLILMSPILILNKLLNIIPRVMKDQRLSWRLVTASLNVDRKSNRFVIWLLRPFQGISLALILAERFLNVFEASIPLLPGGYARLLISDSLFLLLASIFLSTIWAFDDLGIMVYNSRTTELRTAGSSIGTFLPLITGAIGVSALYHSNIGPYGAFFRLIEIIMILYPSYVIAAVLQNELIMRRHSDILSKLRLDQVETKYTKMT